ncbi:hypothetical protein RB653_008707 [Dictyostelium firmibasis]|uniref:IPT/TIG domain-containing protein n=1 Tax=Dictyostelium firmibasis TaxID=79012 RepID=A0AAN7TT64_9MYCE
MKLNFLFVLVILCNIVYNVYSVTTISAVTSARYGVQTYISITGTGFTAGPIVTIGGESCSPVIVASSTSLQCQFSAQLSPGNIGFDVVVKTSSVPSTGGTGLFHYNVPTVSATFPTNGRIGMILVDGPSTVSGYKLNVNDSKNSVQISATADSSSSTVYFVVPNTIAGGQLYLELVQPYSFPSYKTTQSLFNPTINSISPTVLDVTPTNVTINGTYFGNNPSVTMGSHIFSGLVVQDKGSYGLVTFTTRSVYESPDTITVLTSTGILINIDGQGNPIKLNFTYNPPTIVSIVQVNDTVEINTSNTGTDFTQISLTMGNSNITNLVISGTNDKFVTTLPSALPEGETQFNLKAGTTDIISSNLLITPILNNVTQAPYNGGSITITGIFLNNAHVSIVDTQQNKTTDLVCASNPNGESIICPVVAGNGTVDLEITNYKNFALDPTVKTSASISTTYTIAPITPSPTPTPTPTETLKPTETPKPTSTPEPTEAPSSSTVLVSPLPLIFIFISLILLI